MNRRRCSLFSRDGGSACIMSQQGELQGFINVKVPSCMKSRSFIPWKTWKRQWVVVRRSRSSRNGVEILIGKHSPTLVQISPDDVICRTESRTQHYAFGVFPQQSKRRASVYLSGTSETDSQKWIGKIRKLLKPPLLPVEENEFSVSVIDNFFSRSAGLSGLYGTLSVSSDCVTVVDPFTSKTKVEWPWTSLSQFHVSSTIAPEDKGHICTVVTSRSFQAGIGQIHLFCTEGVALAGKLKARGRAASLLSSSERRFPTPTRHHTFSGNSPAKHSTPTSPLSASHAALPKTPHPIPSRPSSLARRLSRSEGNLLSALEDLDPALHASLYVLLDPRTERLHSAYDSEDKVSVDSNDYFFGKGKVAPGILSAGLGLFLPTPGGSEGDNDSLHEYQTVHTGDSDDDIASLSFSMTNSKFSPPRRESGVSIASGVYEEIDDFSLDFDFSTLDLSSPANAQETDSPPPPLPPRREPPSLRNTPTDHHSLPHSLPLPSPAHRPLKSLSRSAGNTPLPSPRPSPRPSPPPSSTPLTLTPQPPQTDPDYLPMLPGCGFLRTPAGAPKEALDEPHYMVMASIKGT